MFMDTMTTSGWALVQGNPRQRNTVLHALRIEPFLQTFIEQHALVHAARFPNGELMKLDGHTRSLLWVEKRIPVPALISVVIFEAPNVDAAKDMYTKYDNSLALERKEDQVFGAFREHGIDPKSKLLRRGTLAYALGATETARLGHTPRRRGGVDVNEAVQEWKPEILILDTIIGGHGSGRTHSGICAAIMLTVRRHGYEKVESFWSQYFDTKTDFHLKDPHVVLVRLLSDSRKENKTSGREGARVITEKALAACANSMAGKRITHLKGLNLTKYLT